MFDYYTFVVIICWLSLIVLGVLVFENNRIDKKDKKIYYIGYVVIILASLAELVGVKISGNPDVNPILIKVVKAFDYILTPLAGVALVTQMKLRNIWFKVLLIVLGVNLLYQVICLFTDWMVVINADNTYSHGGGYYVYIAFYAIVIVLCLVEFIIYGASFRKQNRLSIYAIIAFVIVATLIQELFSFRVAYLGIALGAILLFVHTSEFSQIRSDDVIKEQEKQITTDPLTGLLNRYAYSNALDEFNTSTPENLAIFLIDINGLKNVNDMFGHEAGDELIIGAANCIKDASKEGSKIYRIGGDEFILIAEMNDSDAKAFLGKLDANTSAWKGQKSGHLAVSAGYALAKQHKDCSLEKLAIIADQEMYKAKANYYKQKGIDRRYRK